MFSVAPAKAAIEAAAFGSAEAEHFFKSQVTIQVNFCLQEAIRALFFR